MTTVADEKKSMIVIIIDALTNEKGLREMLQSYSRVQNLRDFLQEINHDAANDLLVKSTPPVLTNYHTEKVLRSFQHLNSTSAQSSPGALGDQGDGCGSVDSTASMPFMAGDSSVDGQLTNNHDGATSRTPSPRVGFTGPIEKYVAVGRIG